VSEDRGGSVALGGEQLFDAMCVLEARCRENAVGLPQQEAQRDLWSGVLFRIGELSLLAPLEEISEVLNVPREVTPVPATRDWVFGIANNRGTLLPMFDLRGFLFGGPTKRSPKSRVLVARRDEFPVGLLVGDVTGIRHFASRLQAQPGQGLPETLAPFVVGSFVVGAAPCQVFSVRRLTLDARFNLTGT